METHGIKKASFSMVSLWFSNHIFSYTTFSRCKVKFWLNRMEFFEHFYNHCEQIYWKLLQTDLFAKIDNANFIRKSISIDTVDTMRINPFASYVRNETFLEGALFRFNKIFLKFTLNKTKWIWIYDREKIRYSAIKGHKRPYKTIKGHTRPH